MQPTVFGYKGFVVKVTAHKLPSNVVDAIAQLKYVASIAIIRPKEGRLSDQIRWIHPKSIYATPEEIIEYGSKYAIQVINNELIEASVDNSTSDKSGHVYTIASDSREPAE
ncbi:MAG: hypothetical protein WBR29_09760 [Gammaproteobacteria bacterium]